MRGVVTAGPFAFGVAIAMPSVALAQKPPTIRQIASLDRVSPDSLGFKSVSAAFAMPGGRVLVNDILGRRVAMLDSTLSHATPIADTTSATANAYGSSWATLIHYRGDSTLLMVPSTLSMFVFTPNGTIARVSSMPRPNEAQMLATAGGFGVPGIDARGRLIYSGTGGGGNSTLLVRYTTQWLENGKPAELARGVMSRGGGWVSPTLQRADSGEILRVDFTTRVMDTAARIRVPSFTRKISVDDAGFVTGIQRTVDPIPLMDQWTVLRDGTVAIVRGRDYHIDWIDGNGRMTSTPKMPFTWERLDEARKTAIMDSVIANSHSTGEPANGQPSRGGRGAVQYVPNLPGRIAPNDLADYYPAFGPRAVTSDWEGNVWIRTSTIVGTRPVYDVVNRRGELVDRVQLPAFRTIAGFGPGVIFTAVKDKVGGVHLERARLR